MHGMERVRDFGALNPKWCVFIIPSPSRLMGLCGKRKQKGCKSQKSWMIPTASSRDNKTDIANWRDCKSIPKTCTCSRQM